jgi:hypothetical protein
MEPFLSSRVPDFIAKHPILQSTLLREEGSTYRRLFIRLEFVGDLWLQVIEYGDIMLREEWRRTKRKTTDDFPTAASPITNKRQKSVSSQNIDFQLY